MTSLTKAMSVDTYWTIQATDTEHDQPLTRHHLAMGKEI
jgi:hypothetical protein